jgi:3-hydroxybutyryl-CoA dehydratase
MIQGDIFKHEFTVSEKVYKGFIDIFRDENPLHTNVEFAQEKGFQGKVMHGNILNGFLSYFIGELLPTKDVMIVSQQIDFKKPVFLNDTLQFSAKVNEVHESVNLVEFKYDFTNSSNVKVAKGTITILLFK